MWNQIRNNEHFVLSSQHLRAFEAMLRLTFGNGKGVVRLTRFERVHLIGLLRLQNQKHQQTEADIGPLSYDEANRSIESGVGVLFD